MLNIAKYRNNLSRHKIKIIVAYETRRLKVEAGRWEKPNKIPYENRKCRRCDILEDKFHFVMEYSLYGD